MIQAPLSHKISPKKYADSLLHHRKELKHVAKTIFDYAIVLPALILLAPLMLIITLLIMAESSGPILHRRRALGKNGREFDVLKFRTMHLNANDLLIRNRQQWVAVLRNDRSVRDPRFTRIGWMLKVSGLEELPRLFNILNRDMSLVGPRLVTRLDMMKYGRNSVEALTSVLPGMTGLGQLTGRRLEECLDEEMAYIDNWSIALDLKILFSTVTVAWKPQNA